ncbi:unnamed protein product [Zymoseptoria tritici ST99CH_1A5]|uniref:Uncharacterized protein n=1 Tax=Zymoseptoria tritici ST99CH_1A5 TaxID=1276529 RepID=A0A1Y6LZS1_ZYMTR|nr:unnamed protein product [Zymoseptoria tritici ST99CH_1A5]
MPHQFDHIYAAFGYDHARCTVDALKAACRDNAIVVSTGAKKLELLRAVEKYYALQREGSGTADESFLDPDFSVKDYTVAKLRQVMSQHDIEYHSAKLSLNEAVAQFEASLDRIRAQYEEDNSGSEGEVEIEDEDEGGGGIEDGIEDEDEEMEDAFEPEIIPEVQPLRQPAPQGPRRGGRNNTTRGNVPASTNVPNVTTRSKTNNTNRANVPNVTTRANTKNASRGNVPTRTNVPNVTTRSNTNNHSANTSNIASQRPTDHTENRTNNRTNNRNNIRSNPNNPANNNPNSGLTNSSRRKFRTNSPPNDGLHNNSNANVNFNVNFLHDTNRSPNITSEQSCSQDRAPTTPLRRTNATNQGAAVDGNIPQTTRVARTARARRSVQDLLADDLSNKFDNIDIAEDQASLDRKRQQVLRLRRLESALEGAITTIVQKLRAGDVFAAADGLVEFAEELELDEKSIHQG